MSAQAKTDNLRREMVSLDLIDPHPDNPNKLSGRAFDLLVDNFERVGMTENVVVRAMPNGRFQMTSGHHRDQAARYLGFTEIPCAIIDDPEFDDEAAAFQLVRMNVIKGKMDPSGFFNLYSKLSEKYTTDVMQELFGFAEQAEFQKLIKQSAKALPPDLQEKFKEAAKEVKTIDGLSKLLNEMFTKHGDSLPFGYMVFDYGGQRNVWLQSSKKTMDAVTAIGALCRENNRTADDVLGAIVQAIANGDLKDAVDAAIAASPAVRLPEDFTGIPTKDDLATYGEM